ncbi:unnamed protein product [Ostreobium quekettii]|uniref:NADP-dependent oxidoreductase domain-containing protein n=1 Tax=Ostreobium quekettii TaxID=121088 RepID=A0A8S1IKT0_9CHLO|nr:unnamed protein product [Ostreobium quekettii]|eukprot:evm.model.scf_2123.3 EVM.evm.TU.scf_2123.3   scf_2123:20170-23782(-)
MAMSATRPLGASGLAAPPQMLRLSARLGRRGQGARNVAHLLQLALAKGMSFVDVTDVLGIEGAAEVIRGWREDLVLALRFGTRNEDGHAVPDSNAASVRLACEAGLQRLGLEGGCIDLFYQEVPDPETPVEATAEALKALIDEGKVRAVGIAGVDADTIQRANSVQPISAVSLQWSAWNPKSSRNGILTVCRELGVGILATKAAGGGVRNAHLLEAAVISEKVKQILDDSHPKVLKRLQAIWDQSAAVLEKQVKRKASIQGDNMSKMVAAILDRQAQGLVVKFRLLLSDQDSHLTAQVQDLAAKQTQHASGRVSALLDRQLEVFGKRVESLSGLPDREFLDRVQKVQKHQQHVLVMRLTRIRRNQADRLLASLGEQLGQASLVAKKADKVLSNQSCRLIAKVLQKQDRQGQRMAVKVQKTQERRRAVAAVKIESILHRRSCQVGKKIGVLLARAPASVPLCVRKRLNQQSEALAVKLHALASKGVRTQRMKVVVHRIMQRQAVAVLAEVESVVERRNSRVGRVAKKALGLDGTPSSEDGTEAEAGMGQPDLLGGLHAATALAISGRIGEVAEARGVELVAACMAWLHHQGEDVFPVAVVGGRGSVLDALVQGAALELTPEEANRMGNPGADELDVDDWDDCDAGLQPIHGHPVHG